MKVPLTPRQALALIAGAAMFTYGLCVQWIWKTTCNCPSGVLPCSCPTQTPANAPLFGYPVMLIGVALIAYSLISIYISRRQHQRVNKEKISTS
jgi:hypothetical protein